MTRRSRNVYHIVPEPTTGYLLNPKYGYFSVIVPEYGTNYISNPSAETSIYGYAAYLGSTVARSTTRARRGIYSVKCTPVANVRSGIQYTATESSVSIPSVFSVDVWAEAGEKLVLSVAFGGGSEIILRHFVGLSRWVRVWGIALGAGAVPVVYIRKDDTFSLKPFYIDGLQQEYNTYPTTYIDGDQVGYKTGILDFYWTGTPHADYSVRTAQCRSGGKVVPFKDYGFEVLGIVGLGMSGVISDIMEFGALDGGEYHDTHTPPRSFSLAGAIFGKSPGEIQRKRRNIINVIKPDLILPKQPAVLRYQFADNCEQEGLVLEIPSIYMDGLGGNFDNHHQERVALNFTEPWPYILEEGNESFELDDLGSTNSQSWAFRNDQGTWSNPGDMMFGIVASKIYDIIESNYYGGLFLCGDFDTVGGIDCDRLVLYYTSTHTLYRYHPFADDIIYTLYEAPDGTLFMGGAFHNIDGVAMSHVARIIPGLGPSACWGGADDVVRAVCSTYEGNVYIGGEFSNVGAGGGAVAAAYIARYNVGTAAWENITAGGASNGHVNKILLGPDNKLYVGGDFTNINGLTGVNHVAVYDPDTGTWAALGTGFTGGNVYDMAFGPDGRLYAVGDFTAPALCFAVFNGANWEPLGSGILTTTTGSTVIFKIRKGIDGKLWMAGDFAIQGPTLRFNCEYVSWDGSTFGYLDAQPPAQADLQACDGLAICPTKGGEIAVAFDYITADPGALFFCGQEQTLVNNGSAAAHPTIILQVSGDHYDYIYIHNFTTGDELRLSPILFDGGRMWIDMTPGNVRTWCNYGAVEKMIFDGSKLATFQLAPGDNIISVYSNRSALATADLGLYWRKNYWGIDDGVP